ncbi:MAG: hypothetical protein ACREF7_02005 [Candidatus Saccharimonadales bacterium]
MKKIKIKGSYRRVYNGVLAVVLGAGLLAPYIFLTSGVAGASAGELEPRSITMSTSAPGATSATYTASFKAATTGTVAGMVIDFCANSPIPGDTCTTGSGSLTGLTITTSDTTSLTGTWVGTSSTATIAKLTCSASCPSVTGGTTVITVTMSNVTNPTPVSYPGSFYARIFTYATSAGATGYTSANPSAGAAVVDQGGDALSTAQTINVQAKVFETLAFCVYSSSCGTAPTATLGISSTHALSTSNTFGSSNVTYQLGTNAANGVTITMTGTTLCSALTLTYANCEGAGTPPTIAAIGSSALAAATNTAQFGMCIDVSGFSSALTPNATYKGDTGSNACPTLTEGTQYTPGTAPLLSTSRFGFNDGNSGNGTNTSGGSTIVTSTGPVATNTGFLTFIANITSTTPSGIYNSSLNLVATPSF